MALVESAGAASRDNWMSGHIDRLQNIAELAKELQARLDLMKLRLEGPSAPGERETDRSTQLEPAGVLGRLEAGDEALAKTLHAAHEIVGRLEAFF